MNKKTCIKKQTQKSTKKQNIITKKQTNNKATHIKKPGKSNNNKNNEQIKDKRTYTHNKETCTQQQKR